jgi:four helix bundle protein
MQDFKKLNVWQKAHELALLTYRLTADFPHEEVFGLRNSLRRTSVDIPALIEEGSAKQGAEFARYITTAVGYANKLEYFSLMSFDLKLMNEENHQLHTEQIIEVRKMLSGFNQRLVP